MAAEALTILTDKLEHEKGAHWLSWLIRLGILAAVIWFQPDGLIALLTVLNWSFWLIFAVITIYGNFQLGYYYYFTLWITTEAAKEAIKMASKGAERIEAKAAAGNETLMRDLQFVERIKFGLNVSNLFSKANRDYVIQRFHQFTKKEHNKLELVKVGSLISAGFFAATPIPGMRSLPAIAFGMIHLRKGLYALMIGNTLRILYMVGIWAFLKNFLGSNFKWAVMTFFMIGLIVMVKQLPYESFLRTVVEKFRSLGRHQ